MGVLQIKQKRQVILSQWWIAANVLNNFFYFVLWHKMDNNMLRLLIIFFLGMFCKLVFCKLQNIRWPSNVTSTAWSKWLKPPYIYGTDWHNVKKKGTLLIKNTTILLLVFWSTRSSRLQMFFKIGVLKNVPIFTWKFLCWSLFLITLQTFSSDLY